MRSLKVNLRRIPEPLNGSLDTPSSRSIESSLDESFLPAGSFSSRRNHKTRQSDSRRQAYPDQPGDLDKRAESPNNFIEYLEYSPSPDQNLTDIRPSSVSLCDSPDPREIEIKLSQTQEIFVSHLFDLDPTQYEVINKPNKKYIGDGGKYKDLCESYEKQNQILRIEVQECSREINRLMKHQEKMKKRYTAINQEAIKARRFIKVIMDSIGNILEEKVEVPRDEHSYNFIASQLQLFQSRIARKQSLFLKTKSSLEQTLQENKQIKRQLAEASDANSQLLEKIQGKKQKIKDLKKIIAKPVEKYTEENDSRINTSGISKSSTPLSEETVVPRRRTKKTRTLSAKDSPIGDSDCYREALKDLKDLSERAHIKITETKKKLKTIPKSFISKSGMKPPGLTEMSHLKPHSFTKYYRN